MRVDKHLHELNTVIVLAISSTLKFGELPGNVVLQKGEAGLPKKSVVNVTQIKTFDKNSLKEKIGSLTKDRIAEVHEGMKLIMGIP
ncbi:MAG: type II toxin-antitoxin system PemK/MazF family toxin [Deltaproteobacteria bacterium]|nr:type II toxin-antitoxin system PemK/MazF family toxin [Deltaproteobacteria bacterium]